MRENMCLGISCRMDLQDGRPMEQHGPIKAQSIHLRFVPSSECRNKFLKLNFYKKKTLAFEDVHLFLGFTRGAL